MTCRRICIFHVCWQAKQIAILFGDRIELSPFRFAHRRRQISPITDACLPPNISHFVRLLYKMILFTSRHTEKIITRVGRCSAFHRPSKIPAAENIVSINLKLQPSQIVCLCKLGQYCWKKRQSNLMTKLPTTAHSMATARGKRFSAMSRSSELRQIVPVARNVRNAELSSAVALIISH